MKRYICLPLSVLILASCASVKTGDFTARKYTHFDNRQVAHIEFRKPKVGAEILYAGTEVGYRSPKEVVLEIQEEVFEEKATEISVKRSTKLRREKASEKQPEKRVEKIFKKTKPAEPSDDSRFWMEILFAVLIPPLGVYLHVKETNQKFWIALGATAAAILTAAIHIPLLPFLLGVGAIAYSVLVVTEAI